MEIKIFILVVLEVIILLVVYALGGHIPSGISLLVIEILVALLYFKVTSGQKTQPITHSVDDDNWREDIQVFVNTAPKDSTLITHLHEQWEFAKRIATPGGVFGKFRFELGDKPYWATNDILIVQMYQRFDVNEYFKRARQEGDVLVVLDPNTRRLATRRRLQYGFYGKVRVLREIPNELKLNTVTNPSTDRHD